MRDWNAVATTAEGKFNQAIRFLGLFGAVEKTAYYNVIMVRANDVMALLKALANEWETGDGRLLLLHRLVPVTATFTFADRSTFEVKAAEVARLWVGQLSNKRFHVRMHRRGFKNRLHSAEEEQFLGRTIMETAGTYGKDGRIAFEDPDAVIAVETIGSDAGMSLWFRDDLLRYPFLGLR